MEKTYLFWKGLEKISKEVNGNENISIGIRPFGFHAGNELTLLAYPWHLCNLVKKEGKKPQFNFFISINDMEPCGLKYLYVDKSNNFYFKEEEITMSEEVPFEYNIFPRTTSFQHTPCLKGCCKSIADHWKKIIGKKLCFLKKEFPGVKIRLIKNSSIKNEPEFKKAITKAINNPELFTQTIDKKEPLIVKKEFLNYGGAICPKCKSAQGKTKLIAGKLTFKCKNCGQITRNSSREKSDFWMYYAFILPPRIKMQKIDICIRGLDHYRRKNVQINDYIYKKIYGEEPLVKTIITPLITDKSGKKMSKTRANDKEEKISKLIKATEGNNSQKITL